MRMLLLAKNLLFTVVVPGTVAVYVPLSVISHGAVGGAVRATVGLFLIATGACVYLWCIWDFASFGRGTPAPIDPPQRLVERWSYEEPHLKRMFGPSYEQYCSRVGRWLSLRKPVAE